MADIYFDEKVDKIKLRSERPVEWEKIDSRQKWESYKSSIDNHQNPEAAEIVNGDGMLVIPGAVDGHVHFNTPGYETREDFEHGSGAAIAGGVTTVIDMPCTSIPPVTCAENFDTKIVALKNRSLTDYALWGGVSGNDFNTSSDLHNRIPKLAGKGIVGFKTYLLSGMSSFTDLSTEQLEQVAVWVKETGLVLAIHAEDKKLVTTRENELRKLGRNNWRAYCTARDSNAELIAVKNAYHIAKKTGCRIHIVHLISKEGLNTIRKAKAEGINMSAETCPHYLYFTQQDFDKPEISAFLKTAPPVKHEEDKAALWQGLNDGTLDFVTTDHAGCIPEVEKSSDNFWDIYGGIPGVEHRVPFMLSEGFKKGRLTLQQTLELLCENPAKFYKLDHCKGKLEPGMDADMVLVDLWQDQTIDARDMHSKGKYTPFEAETFSVCLRQTWLRGRKMCDNGGNLTNDFNYGQFIRSVN